ncbi:MAG: hypothetical protein JO066_15420 [Verrucomicrobia bacterium]|nr:hypothetical protein [Verrucomicrobiota bacterium]
MPPEEGQMSLDVWCNLLERELKTALEQLEKIRKADKHQAKNTCHMLGAALAGARHYLREIQESLVFGGSTEVLINATTGGVRNEYLASETFNEQPGRSPSLGLSGEMP